MHPAVKALLTRRTPRDGERRRDAARDGGERGVPSTTPCALFFSSSCRALARPNHIFYMFSTCVKTSLLPGWHSQLRPRRICSAFPGSALAIDHLLQNKEWMLDDPSAKVTSARCCVKHLQCLPAPAHTIPLATLVLIGR